LRSRISNARRCCRTCPTLDESGLKGYQIVGWNGLFVPAGTPVPIVSKLHAEVVRVLALPEVQQRLATMGADGVGNTPQQFAAFIRAEIPKWARVVKKPTSRPSSAARAAHGMNAVLARDASCSLQPDSGRRWTAVFFWRQHGQARVL
jgi:hypothetical protein